MWKLDTYFEGLYKIMQTEQDTDHSQRNHRKYLSSMLRQALGDFPEKSPEYKIDILESEDNPDYIRERICFQTAEGLAVPIYVLTPKVGSLESFPAVLALHGHGYGSREIVGLLPDGSEDNGEPGSHQHFALQLVKKGMKVFAPEVLGFGDRMLKHDQEHNKPCSCYTMATHLLLYGKTLAGIRVFEAIRTIDILNLFDDVDNDSIGIMGFSGGGLIAAYASSLDERIKATVLSGFANTFKGSILSNEHCIDNYLPGILQYAELPELIGLIAPRKLFVESGTKDTVFPVEHAKKAIAALEKTYVQFQANGQFFYDIFEGKHEISGRRSYDWLRAALKS
ncbi:alpha/beta hydrolase family protein [Jeotgalibacillus soli]|uniref:Dienelactone hydrolase domain-containing protein n=1 Tax=Jeotgalibacillus soli TaxID=889306 RepID=A0A0C2VN10_9BACL|nr:alpha/beta hydrolase family protein [Jeotgalibacillus soli]KIL45388.1 hypothetical protein KP78_29320 [Jeotgalibacillus soli]